MQEEALGRTFCTPPAWAPSPRWGWRRPSLEGRSQPGLCSQTLCSPGRLFPPCVRESVMFLACPPGGQCGGEEEFLETDQKPVHRATRDLLHLPPLPFHRAQKQQVFDPRSVSHPGSRAWDSGLSCGLSYPGGSNQSTHSSFSLHLWLGHTRARNVRLGAQATERSHRNMTARGNGVREGAQRPHWEGLRSLPAVTASCQVLSEGFCKISFY